MEISPNLAAYLALQSAWTQSVRGDASYLQTVSAACDAQWARLAPDEKTFANFIRRFEAYAAHVTGEVSR